MADEDFVADLTTTLRGAFDTALQGYDKTGATSGTAVLQAALDSSSHVRIPGGTLLLSTAVFLDSASALGTAAPGMYVLDGLGVTTLKLGTGLPTASSYGGATGFAFYPNTERAALSGSAVTTSTGNRSSGTAFPSAPRLILRNFIIDGGGGDLGVVFGNTCVTRFESCHFRSLKIGQSWTGYADGAAVIGGQVSLSPTGSWLIDQISNGDGVLIDSVKCTVGGLWRANTCQGGRVTNVINGGLSFRNSRGIVIDGGHWEADNNIGSAAPFPPNTPVIDVDCSHVTVTSPFNYASEDTTVPFLRINDTAGENSSDVSIENPVFSDYLRDNDAPRSADIHIAAFNASSRLRVTRPTGVVIASGAAPHYRDGIVVTSAVGGITTALAAARHLVAGSAWELRKRDTGYEVAAPSPLAGITVARRLTTPVLSQVAADTDVSGGTLGSGTTYEYAVALRDAAGLYTAASAAVSAAATAIGALRLIGTVDRPPATLVAWRKVGAGVLATPDAYVEIPVDANSYRLYDTGTYLNGRPWVTTSVPVPNTVAAANNTFDRIMWSDGTIQAKSLFVRKSANETLNNVAVPQDDDHLTLPVEVNAIYLVESLLIYEATVAADFKMTWQAPAGSTLQITPWSLTSTSTGVAGSIHAQVRTLSDVHAIGGAGAGAKVVARPAGVLTTGTTAGNFKLQWAQSTAEVSDAIMYADSWLRLTRIA